MIGELLDIQCSDWRVWLEHGDSALALQSARVTWSDIRICITVHDTNTYASQINDRLLDIICSEKICATKTRDNMVLGKYVLVRY